MKNFAVIAAIAVVSFTNIMEAAEHVKKHMHHHHVAKHHSSSSSSSSSTHHHHHKKHSVPSGSYYADSTSQNPLQTLLISTEPPVTAPVHFSGTNVNHHGVSLSPDGNSITVPKKGIYKIEWNTSLAYVQSSDVFYHFDLQKNGTTLLHPIPQVIGQTGNGILASPTTSAAASVLVPLHCGDTISLLLTIDGSEGNNPGDGVQINSAQISATWVSPLHK